MIVRTRSGKNRLPFYYSIWQRCTQCYGQGSFLVVLVHFLIQKIILFLLGIGILCFYNDVDPGGELKNSGKKLN